MFANLVIVASVFVLTQAKLSPEFQEKVKAEVEKTAEICVAETKATPDDITELLMGKYPPSTHEGKCMLFCFYKQYQYMKPDGAVDFDSGIKIFENVKLEDADLYAQIMEIAHKCGEHPTIESDPCDTASTIATCFKREADARHLKEMYM